MRFLSGASGAVTPTGSLFQFTVRCDSVNSMEFEAPIERFVEALTRTPRGQGTAGVYARHILRLAVCAGAQGRRSWDEVTADDVMRFITSEYGTRAPATKRQVHAAVRRFFDYLRESEGASVLALPPPLEAGIPRAELVRPEPLPVTVWDAADYFAKAREKLGYGGLEAHEIRTLAAAGLIYDLGMRVSEIVGLPRSAYDESQRTLQLPNRGVVQLREAADFLAEWVAVRDKITAEPDIFVVYRKSGWKPMTRQWLWKALQHQTKTRLAVSPDTLRAVAVAHALHGGATIFQACARFGMDRTSVLRIIGRYGKTPAAL